MILREIKIGELVDFVNTTFYKNAKHLPITPQRAISQANNPYAKKEDVALILAINNQEQLVGYIGIMPGKTTFSDERFFWNTCWWVDKEEGKAAAMPLLYAMLKLCNFNVIFFDLTPHTKIIVEKLGFSTQVSEGIKVFLRFNTAQILPKKKSFFRYLKPLLYFSDVVFNTLYSIRLKTHKSKHRTSFSIIDALDEEAIHFLEKKQKSLVVPFDNLKLNWIMQYPWLITTPNEEERAMAKKYYFSYIAASFAIKIIKIIENKTVVGLVIATIREGDMKLSYCFYNENCCSQLTQAIVEFVIGNNINSITTFTASIANELQKKPSVFAKKVIKHSAYPKKCIELGISTKVFQDGDGDAVFT